MVCCLLPRSVLCNQILRLLLTARLSGCIVCVCPAKCTITLEGTFKAPSQKSLRGFTLHNAYIEILSTLLHSNLS